MIELQIKCPFCGKEHSVLVTEEEWALYEGGALAQVAFARLGSTEREQIISQICPDCQKSIFGEDE